MGDSKFGIGFSDASKRFMTKRLGLAAKSARMPEGEAGNDHISLLSDHILIKILSLLPLVEAAKTSILSKRWRYLWSSIPTLDFTDFFLTHSAVVDSHGTKMEGSIYEHTDEEAKKFVSIFYQIFNFRQAPVHGCSLPIFDFKQCLFDLNNFLLFLYKLCIPHLILRNVGRLDNTLSPDLYYFQSLKELGIWDCPVLFPSQFKVLTNLRNLKLIRVRISNRQLEILVSGCPNLENLNLKDCPNLHDFQICSRNLLLLDIEMSEWTRFSLIDAPRLKHVTLSDPVYLLDDLDDSSGEKEEEDDHLVKLLMNLSHIERFSITCYKEIFKYTSIEQLPDSLPTGHQLANLKELSIRLTLSDAKMVSFLLFLLRSCPNLQQLSLEDTYMGPGSPFETDYWEKQRPPKCLINRLTNIRIEDVGLWDKNVFDLMKFFLLNALVLIKMSITISCSRFDWGYGEIDYSEEVLSPQKGFSTCFDRIQGQGKAREQGLTSIKMMYDAVDAINAIKGADDWFTSSYVLVILDCASHCVSFDYVPRVFNDAVHLAAKFGHWYDVSFVWTDVFPDWLTGPPL